MEAIANRRGPWNGRYAPGAMTDHRRTKRLEAEERNAKTPKDRRRQTRVAKIRNGELVPHPNSRDAKVRRPAQKR
jgi:hypothetical protein